MLNADKGGGGSKIGKILRTSFMDGLLVKIILCVDYRGPKNFARNSKIMVNNTRNVSLWSRVS